MTAVDSTRCAAELAGCYVATDADVVDAAALERAVAELNAVPGRPGYVTETFCERSRFFQPFNGARIDAVRDAIAERHAGNVARARARSRAFSRLPTGWTRPPVSRWRT